MESMFTALGAGVAWLIAWWWAWLSPWGSALGVVVGAAITWFVAWWYYEKASAELIAETQALRRLNTLILEALETSGHAKLVRDERGEISGLRFDLRANGITTGPPDQGHPELRSY
jgi:hypothetical protein